MRVLIAALTLFWLQSAAALPGWIDGSHDIFMTKKLNAATSRYRDYPVFWWNFVVIEGEVTEHQLEAICAELNRDWKGSLSKLPCALDAAELARLTKDWVTDLPRRIPYPGNARMQQQLNSTLAKAGMPMSRDLLELLRRDPLNSLADLQERVRSRARFKIPARGGMILDPSSKMAWMPVQLNFSPADSARTAQLISVFDSLCARTESCRNISMFGPHFATAENEQRIRADIGAVSTAGTIALFLLAGFVIFTRRHRLALLIPILLAGLALATAATVAVFGKIHGITLAFGPGIVGLAMDYGVHAVFLNPRSKSTWRSNRAGLITTLVILFMMMFSAIPLLRQLMFFSALGLIISYLLFYVLLYNRPTWFETPAYNFTPKSWRPGEWLAIGMIAGVFSLLALNLSLGVQQMNFESSGTKQLREWFAANSASLPPYWIEEDLEDPLASSHLAKAWAAENQIAFEGAANFLPAKEDQEENLQTWRAVLCPENKIPLTPVQKKFFQPFFESLTCASLTPRNLKDTPDYIADLGHGGQWLSLMFPANEEQVAAVKAKYRSAGTPREVFSEFPRVFVKELSWMIPVSLIGALLFLWNHFRSVRGTFLSIVPFLSGAGCFALVALAFNFNLTFISLIGLLMVFGFSLDYGIFVVDLLRAKNEGKFGVWSALSVCSFAALAGFAPLVFARHPVLNDLGQALLWGSLGTYVGTFWGIPALFRWLNKEETA